LEIDPMTGNLFVARDRAISGGPRFSPVLELGDPGEINVADIDLVDVHVNGTGLQWSGMGIDPDGGDLYLTSNLFLLVVNDGPLPPAVVTFEPYSDVRFRGATVNFSIDTTGLVPVGYELQIAGASGIFNTIATGTIAGSNQPVSVSYPVTGLRPGSEYSIRVVTSKAFNNSGATIDGSTLLVTEAEAPSVIDVRADSITDSSARLAGRGGSIPTASRGRAIALGRARVTSRYRPMARLCLRSVRLSMPTTSCAPSESAIRWAGLTAACLRGETSVVRRFVLAGGGRDR
jgi:hypothetical protein